MVLGNVAGWPSGIGQVSPPIHRLTTSQEAVFLINSWQGCFWCFLNKFRKALSLTYGCFFAEFLEDLSLVHLTLLELTTCVGLRYGLYIFKLREFSRKFALINPPRRTVMFLLHFRSSLKKEFRIYRNSQSCHKRKSINALIILIFVLPSQYIKVMEY